MTSASTASPAYDFSADASPQSKVNATQLDAEFAALYNKHNALIGVLNQVLRDDDQITNAYVRLVTLHDEVKTTIATAGIQVYDAVKTVSTANIDLATGGLLTVNGYTLGSGERVLVAAQTDGTENGIYTAAAGAWSRATDLDATADFPSGKQVVVGIETGAQAGDTYVCINVDPTLGTTSLTWTLWGSSTPQEEFSAVTARTADFTLAVADNQSLQLCDTSGGDITVTLPAANDAGVGFHAWFVKTAAANQLIIGSGPVRSTGRVGLVLVASDGTNWQVVQHEVRDQRVLEVDDLASLKALTGDDLAGVVYMRHHTNAGDGGGGLFRWDGSSSATADDGITVTPTSVGGGNGRWIRQYKATGSINVRWYGAQGDGSTDDYAAVAAAVTKAGNADAVYFPGGGNYRIESSLTLASEIALVGDGSTVSKIYCHGVPLFDYTTASGINTCRIQGLSLIATNTVAKIAQMDNISYSRFEDVLFDGNNNATDGLIVQGTAGTIAYNDFVACDFIDCGGVGLKIGSTGQTQTWFRFQRCRFTNNATNFTIHGKQHVFHACSIENSAENDVHSPLTTFTQCWIESSDVHFHTGAYGCAVIDCRSRGGTLDNTDYHLRNWIVDDTIKEFAFNKHSPGLMYREGNRELKFIYGDRPININTGLGLPYTAFLGPRKPFTIVGYGFFVHAGGSITPASTKLEVFRTLDSYKDDPLTVAASIKQFTVLSSSYASNDTEIVTWTDDVSVYHDHNPSSALVNGIGMRFTASEANNLRIFPFLIVVE